MAKITEDYVSFEVAKLLKEKGFDEKCSRWYVANEPQEGLVVSGFGENQFYINAPTQSMVMKWLREVYKLSIEPYSIAIEENCIGYAYAICSCKTGLEIFAERWDGKNPFVSYEEAVEIAIKHCLENLI